VGYLPHVMTKLKRDANLIDLLGLIRSLTQRALKMFGIVKIEHNLHPKNNEKRKSLDL